jgi:hypothetical protein
MSRPRIGSLAAQAAAASTPAAAPLTRLSNIPLPYFWAFWYMAPNGSSIPSRPLGQRRRRLFSSSDSVERLEPAVLKHVEDHVTDGDLSPAVQHPLTETLVDQEEDPVALAAKIGDPCRVRKTAVRLASDHRPSGGGDGRAAIR